MKILSLIILLSTGCTYLGIRKGEVSRVRLKNYSEFDAKDYEDHLESFEKTYLRTNSKKIIPLSKSSNKYLNSIVERIIKTNELFFLKKIKPRFHIIKSKTPFHFSLPRRKFFISSVILKKYITNESMLYCMILFELIKSEKNLYKKNIIIPTGTLSTSRVLSLLRLETQDKFEIHKWAFYILKRIGMDTDSYLSWLQMKNRNSLDFSLQIGNVESISREEALFKSFLIQEIQNNRRRSEFRSSSKRFYSFIKNVKG